MQKKFEDAVDDLYLNGLILGLNITGGITASELNKFDERELKEFLKQEDYQTKEPILLKSPSVDTMLHIAVEQKELTVVECLLVCGAQVNEPEGCGATPLMLAVCSGHELICKLLISYGARATGTLRPYIFAFAHGD